MRSLLVMIFDPEQETWDALTLPPDGPLAPGSPLTAGALCPAGGGCFLWTDKRLLSAYDRLCLLLGCPAPVRYGFRRPGDHRHRCQSAHCAGLALDLMLPREDARPLLTRLARESGFDRVEPPFLSPAWVHAECVITAAARSRPGYPLLRPGDRGVHVMVLQDLLLSAGIYYCGLTGVFSEATSRALYLFQRASGLPATGRADAASWESLLQPRSILSQYPPSRDLM